MEQQPKSKNYSQSISCPFRGKVEKLLYSNLEEDKLIGMQLLIREFNLHKREGDILFWYKRGWTIVIKDSSPRQLEIVIGKYGLCIRKITSIQAQGTKTLWI